MGLGAALLLPRKGLERRDMKRPGMGWASGCTERVEKGRERQPAWSVAGRSHLVSGETGCLRRP